MDKFKFYKPEGKLMWDLWFLKDKDKYHAFYLQHDEKTALKNRHDNVSIGHALSKDLVKWKEIGTALEPGKKGEWDDLALWTGSIIKKGKRYFLFYTGRHNKKGEKWIQKIGLATSENMVNWEKHEKNPILESDDKHYDLNNKKNRLGKIPTFRDPFVFQDKKSKKYYMFFSARRKGRKKVFNGCVGAAVSKDLLKWKLLKPVLAPDRYDEMECCQLVQHKGYYYLFFLVPWEECYDPKWASYFGRYPGLHCYYSKSLFGKYKPVNGSGVVISNGRRIYGERLIEEKKGKFKAVGWLNFNPHGEFVGKMARPFEVVINKNPKVNYTQGDIQNWLANTRTKERMNTALSQIYLPEEFRNVPIWCHY